MSKTISISIEDEAQFAEAVDALRGPVMDWISETDATSLRQDALLAHLAAALEGGVFRGLSAEEAAMARQYDDDGDEED